MKLPITLLFAFAIYSSCTKEYLRSSIVLVPDEFHSYFFFDSGSYWIYQDTVTNDFDTLTCDFSVDDTTTDLENNMFYENAYSHFINKGWWNLGNNISNSCRTYQSNKDSLYVSVLSGFDLRSPIVVGNICDQILCTNCIVISHVDSILNSYSVNSFSLGKTIVVSVQNDNNQTGQNSQYYFSGGVGLIRYIRNGDYKLVSYHLE